MKVKQKTKVHNTNKNVVNVRIGDAKRRRRNNKKKPSGKSEGGSSTHRGGGGGGIAMMPPIIIQAPQQPQTLVPVRQEVPLSNNNPVPQPIQQPTPAPAPAVEPVKEMKFSTPEKETSDRELDFSPVKPNKMSDDKEFIKPPSISGASISNVSKSQYQPLFVEDSDEDEVDVFNRPAERRRRAKNRPKEVIQAEKEAKLAKQLEKQRLREEKQRQEEERRLENERRKEAQRLEKERQKQEKPKKKKG